jgi:hypothetical protein
MDDRRWILSEDRQGLHAGTRYYGVLYELGMGIVGNLDISAQYDVIDQILLLGEIYVTKIDEV